MMMFLLQLLLATALIGLSLLLAYLWFLALSYLFQKKQHTGLAAQPSSRFVFVVPAHNEELGITATVQSLLSVQYPRSLFDVVVVADNCSDATAEQARAAGAVCLERHDINLRGKGYALRYAFTELIPKGYDCFIVIDADSVVSPNFLLVLDARLCRGERVIQAYDGLSNPDASILTYLFQVGNLIENKLFWQPKESYHLPIMLRGNGMCFASDILEAHPWSAFSIVEDTEYGLLLIKNGVRIHFAADIGVYATQPETLQQAFAQRVRWASGNATLTKGKALGLIQAGITSNNANLVDFGLSLIVGSRPLLLLANILLIICSVISGSKPLVIWAISLLLAQFAYIGCGVLLNGITVRKMWRLFASPFYLAWLTMVSVFGLAGFRKNQWTRTARQ